jgi:hypothetical protein
MGFINSAVVLVSMMERPEMDFPGLFFLGSGQGSEEIPISGPRIGLMIEIPKKG